MPTVVSPSATVVLDSNGNGRVSIAPPAGAAWQLRLAVASTNGTLNTPTATIYRGSSSGPLTQVDSTFLGNSASTGKVAGLPFFSDQPLWAVWAGGDPGATATLQAYGVQGPRREYPFDSSAVGEGFPLSVAASLLIGLGGSVFFGSTVPAELTAFYSSTRGVDIPAVLIFYIDSAHQTYAYIALTNFVSVGSRPGLGFGMVNLAAGPPVVGEYIYFYRYEDSGPDHLGSVTFGELAGQSPGALDQRFEYYFGSDVKIANVPNVGNAGTVHIGYGNGLSFANDGTTATGFGRGYIDNVNDQTVQPAIAAPAETQVLAGNASKFRTGRAYRVHYRGSFVASVLCNQTLRLRRNSDGVAIAAHVYFTPAAGTFQREASVILRRTGADSTDAINLSAQPSAGNCTPSGSALNPLVLEIEDIGFAADFAGYPTF
jgi:hypothetical protein